MIIAKKANIWLKKNLLITIQCVGFALEPQSLKTAREHKWSYTYIERELYLLFMQMLFQNLKVIVTYENVACRAK